MAAPPLAVGTYVQYNPSTDSPRSAPASAIENTIGQIRQAYTAQGQSYYQVVWNPGDQNPRVATYHASELTPLTSQQASETLAALAAGTFQPATSTQSSNYLQSSLPTSALPPSLQGAGSFTAAPQSQTPSLEETG